MISTISNQSNPLTLTSSSTQLQQTKSSHNVETQPKPTGISAEQAQALSAKISSANPAQLFSSVNVSLLVSNQTFSLIA